VTLSPTLPRPGRSQDRPGLRASHPAVGGSRFPRVMAVAQESAVVAALRAGDERTFALLVDTYTASMRRLAYGIVRNATVADDVVQEAWLGVLRGIGRFEGRSSLKTWIFRILTNTAKTRAEREGRSTPFSSFETDAADDEPSLDPSRFQNPRFPGGWTSFPEPWDLPEERLLAAETREAIRAAIERLPDAQRLVISLRDVEGWSSEEVCAVLDVSEANQRVLLHRARSKVRSALETYFDDGGRTDGG
jgi:RNA polymerase sigma-70 factor (ECF subfamily)